MKLKFNFIFNITVPKKGIPLRKAFLLPFALLASLSAFGQQPAFSPESASQATQITTDARIQALTAQLERQQAQIEALERVQQQLLDRLGIDVPALTSSTPANAVASPVSGAASTAQLPAPASDSARASGYVAQRSEQSRIQLGDRVRVGGYGSFRFETNDVASGSHIPSGSDAGFTFRRFVVTTDARPAPRLRVYSEIEYERFHQLELEKGASFSGGELAFEHAVEGNGGGELALEQAWGQFDLTANHGLRGGVMLVPVGRFNLLHDDDYWDIPRRTLVDRDGAVLPVKAAWRDLGAGFVGSWNVGARGKLDYQLFAFNGAALDFNIEKEAKFRAGAPGEATAIFNSNFGLASGFFDGSKGASAFAWRAAYSPDLHGEFAFSGYRGKYAPSFLSFREPLTSLAYDHKWRWRGFETEGEFVYTSLGNVRRVTDAIASAVFNSANAQLPTSSSGGLTTVEVESELSNFARARYGFWSDFKYHARPRWLRESFLGKGFEDPQLIPIVRYERIWLNDVISGLRITSGAVSSFDRQDYRQDRVTAGFSFRPTPQWAVQAAFEHNRKLDGARLVFPRVAQDSTNGLLVGMSFAF